jgi:hypothetical protein
MAILWATHGMRQVHTERRIHGRMLMLVRTASSSGSDGCEDGTRNPVNHPMFLFHGGKDWKNIFCFTNMPNHFVSSCFLFCCCWKSLTGRPGPVNIHFDQCNTVSHNNFDVNLLRNSNVRAEASARIESAMNCARDPTLTLVVVLFTMCGKRRRLKRI